MAATTLRQTGMLLLIALCAAGCGRSSSSTRHSTSVPATATTMKPQSHARRTPPSSHSVKKAATDPTVTTSPAGLGTRTTPPPIPAGTPPAPDGLRQSTGYSTYELCASDCSGTVPLGLRRPLRLPSISAGGACRVSPGNGPVKQVGSATTLKLQQFVGSAWAGGQVTWTAAGYSGPVLIRGRELGGPHAVGFGEGHVPYDELQLLGPAMGAPRGQWPSFTRVRGPGCYAYQVDGESFSEVIVFRAVG
jgi:hypothetical protein